MFDLIPDMARKRAELSPDGVAFRDGMRGRAWRFAEVNRAADAIAAALTAEGYRAGDRLAILTLNRIEFFLILLACQKTGVILCPLNWRQPVPELIDTLEIVTPKGLLHDATNAAPAVALAAHLGLKRHSLDTDLPGWTQAHAPACTALIPGDRPWYLLFTSGTTGRPKAVIQTARMAWANAVNIGLATGMTAADRSVNFLPLFHTAGINLYTLPLFLHGGASVVLPKFEPADLLALLAAGAVTQFFGVPAIYQAFSTESAIETIDWTTIRCGCGGAPLAEPLIRFFAARGARVLNGCGMTETGPTVFLMDPDHAEDRIGSVGHPQALTECRLSGVPDGTPGEGEIQLRGPNITPGYFDDASATAAAFTPDGWLKTGDIGRRDGDGFYDIIDRIKDMYISGGENVYPAEVERALVHHPAILEAAVIGVPDARWGEVGAAFVLPRPGAVIDPDTIRPWCRERLAGYKVPAHIRVVGDFPRTAAGKIRKPDLRGAFA